MKHTTVALLVLLALLSVFGLQVSASPQGAFVLEGGINRTEGFVPFVAGTTVQTSTANPYDVVATVYRTNDTLASIRVEIGGGSSTWQPWVASGVGTPTFENGRWVFQMAFPSDGKVEIGLRVPQQASAVHIVVTATDGASTEVRSADVSPAGQPPTATPEPTPTPSPVVESEIVLEGGINRTEGFVPFVAGVTIQAQTGASYDVMSTVYRVDGTLSEVRVEIAGGQSNWEPWVSSGIGTPTFQSGTWIFQMQFPLDGKVEVGLRAPAPSVNDHISVTAVAGGITEVRRADIAPVPQTPTLTPTSTSTNVPPTPTATTTATATATPSPTATAEPRLVLEGGINRTEGFVPFVAGVTVQTSTSNPYDVVSTVYRTDSTLSGVRIEITGGQQSWTPWIGSGTGASAFQAGSWIFQMQFSLGGEVEVGLHASAPASTTDHISVSASAGTDTEVRKVDVKSGRRVLYLPFVVK